MTQARATPRTTDRLGERAEADARRQLAGRPPGWAWPAAAGMGGQIMAVGADCDRAVEVRPEELSAALLEPGNRVRRRVAVRIAPAGADDGDSRRHLGHECVRRGG